MNIGINNKPAAGQAVPHLHWHIIPRYENDGGGSMHSIVQSAEKIEVSDIAKLFASA
jgi:histidine triad (HIT) family protein